MPLHMFGSFRRKSAASALSEPRESFDVPSVLERRDGLPVFAHAAWEHALGDLADDDDTTVVAERLTAAAR
jgi:hypothetical protein